MVESFEIEMFFDGDCPLCMRETHLLERLDRKNGIRFTNIAASGFVTTDHAKSHEDFMAERHGRLLEGSVPPLVLIRLSG
jgi:predicted DCC family thiol-disulfide oxidoreductase YuxK